tara:strand:- start:640 stop:1059 length:420 start_codon:yes stop_codon:yes gene_type:complete
LIATPNTEKTTENPSTKNTELKNTFVLLTESMFFSVLTSDKVVPEIYAKNAGTIGNIHGAKNEPIPAKNAIMIGTSAILLLLFNFIKLLTLLVFILGSLDFNMNSRFYITIAVLGVIAGIAYFIGAPTTGGGLGFDMMR